MPDHRSALGKRLSREYGVLVAGLALNGDLLVRREAGRVARASGVRRLFLAHVGYRQHTRLGVRVQEARRAFGGSVAMVEELRWYRV